MNPQNSQPANSLICRHIKTNGRRCQAFAVGSGVYCYYHRTLNRGHRAAATVKVPVLCPESAHYLIDNGLAQPPDPKPVLHFPPLEDADSIQLALSMLFTAVLAGQMRAAHARTLLYTLQIASYNFRSTTAARAAASASEEQDERSTVVRRIVRNRHGQALAAPDDTNHVPEPSERPQSSLEYFEPYHADPYHADKDALEAQSTPLQPLKQLEPPEPMQPDPFATISSATGCPAASSQIPAVSSQIPTPSSQIPAVSSQIQPNKYNGMKYLAVSPIESNMDGRHVIAGQTN